MSEISGRVLIIDDNKETDEDISEILGLAGYEVTFIEINQFTVMSPFDYDAVLLGFPLSEKNGFDVLMEIHGKNPSILAVILARNERMEDSITFSKRGAVYLPRPIKSEKLLALLEKTVIGKQEEQKLKNENNRATINSDSASGSAVAEEIRRDSKYYAGDENKVKGEENSLVNNMGIIGDSEGIKKVREQIRTFAESNISILILGETGVGKELVAQAIHDESKRPGKYVCENLRLTASTLIEDKLVGHEPGAFDGAKARRLGVFEEADKGTVFLDEIHYLDDELQGRLMRILQEKEITRQGSNKAVKVDFRLITASQPGDFHTALQNGTFREDLKFRILQNKIMMPSLRERKEDIPLLAGHFLDMYGKSGNLLEIDNDAVSILQNDDWPGNVRELVSCINNAICIAESSGKKTIDSGIIKTALQNIRFSADIKKIAGLDWVFLEIENLLNKRNIPEKNCNQIIQRIRIYLELENDKGKKYFGTEKQYYIAYEILKKLNGRLCKDKFTLVQIENDFREHFNISFNATVYNNHVYPNRSPWDKNKKLKSINVFLDQEIFPLLHAKKKDIKVHRPVFVMLMLIGVIAVTGIIIKAIVPEFLSGRKSESLWQLPQTLGIAKTNQEKIPDDIGVSRNEIVILSSKETNINGIQQGTEFMSLNCEKGKFISVGFQGETIPVKKVSKLLLNCTAFILQSTFNGYGRINAYSVDGNGTAANIGESMPIFYIPAQLSTKKINAILKEQPSAKEANELKEFIDGTYPVGNTTVRTLDKKIQSYFITGSGTIEEINKVDRLILMLGGNPLARDTEFAFELTAPPEERARISIVANEGHWALVIKSLILEEVK